MKKIFLSIVLLSFIVGCKDDYLNVDEYWKKDATEFFKTQDDAIQATSAIYSFLRSWENSAFPYQYLFGVPADDVEKGSNLVMHHLLMSIIISLIHKATGE